MNTATNVVAHPSTGNFSAAQLKLIRETVAADCNSMEFDLFVTVARNAGLDPFRKQISALVFNKNKPDKRRMSIVTTIDGLRVIAARSGRYRPDEDEPEYTYDPDLKGPTNPLGLVKAKVRIWIADSKKEGGWKPVTGVAYWDEFAPISDEWAEGADGKRRPTGKKTLDTGGQWGKMGRIMIAKCAEAQALRKAFPEDLSALYEGAEFDRSRVEELAPSEAIGALETEGRMQRIGSAGGIIFQLFPNSALEAIPVGQVADRVLETINSFSTFAQMHWFEGANTQPLREFWARSPGDALELKKRMEAIRAKLEVEARALSDERLSEKG
jgi:phage recombination protein Bet